MVAPLHIAITGATGFVGRHVVQAFLDAGHRVTALVRNERTAQLPESVRLVVGDLSNETALQMLMLEADAVVHIAGAIMALDRTGFFAVNAAGCEAVARAAVKNKVSRVVYVSSLAAREPQLSHYAASKRVSEEIMQDKLVGKSLIILRPAAIYGPGDRATLPMLRALMKSIAILPGRAENRFSLLYVKDFAAVVLAAVEGDEQGTYEIGDDVEAGYSWSEVMAISQRVQGAPQRVIMLPKFLPMAIAWVAEVVSRIRQKPSIISRGKIAEIYHHDWVAKGPQMRRTKPTGLAVGFAETYAWYFEKKWLPRPKSASTQTL